MDSPGQISPSLSCPSSSSPPAEEGNFQAPSGGTFDKSFIGTLTSHLSPFTGASKRRLGGGSTYTTGGSARDPKSRRRENSGRMDSGNWDAKGPGGGKREKDEFLDQNIVDFLRKGVHV